MSPSFPAHRGDVRLTRTILLLQVSAIYFVLSLLLSLIAVFAQGEGKGLFLDDNGAAWRGVFVFFYYCVPVILAILFGVFFRPFWVSALKILFFIGVMQFSMSLVGYTLRDHIVRQQEDDLSRSRLVLFHFKNFTHQFVNQKQDGTIDQVNMEGEGELADFPSGEYILNTLLIQDGQVLPQNPVSSLSQRIVTGRPRQFRVKFSFNPRLFTKYFKKGEVQVVLSLQKKFSLTKKEREEVAWAQLTPFFHTVPWEKRDPLLEPQAMSLDISQTVDRLQIADLNAL